jgi:hypothetical protein
LAAHPGRQAERGREPGDVIELLAAIDAPHFHCAVVLWDDVVVEAAPIVRKALKGKTRDYVRSYCARKGWTVSVIHQIEREHPWQTTKTTPPPSSPKTSPTRAS